MTVEEIKHNIAALSPAEQEEITTFLLQLADPEQTDDTSQGHEREIPPHIEAAQRDEVRRRIAEVKAGRVTLIPGDEAMAQVRRLVDAARRAA